MIVNRVWHHLFGSGLVKTVDNFGVTGDVPSHPELLDHLATRFVHDGWSIKKLVRAIVLTPGLSVESRALRPSPNMAVDPDNRLVWRHTPRRLDAEEIRDATLAAAGQLDLSRPVGSPAMQSAGHRAAEQRAAGQRLAAAAAAAGIAAFICRSLRGLTPNSLAVFDFAEQGMVTGGRDTTTVAPQALYLLNDPFVRPQSQALAAQLARGHTTRRRRADRSGLSAGLRPPGAARPKPRAAADYLAAYAVAVNDGQAASRNSKVAGKTRRPRRLPPRPTGPRMPGRRFAK